MKKYLILLLAPLFLTSCFGKVDFESLMLDMQSDAGNSIETLSNSTVGNYDAFSGKVSLDSPEAKGVVNFDVDGITDYEKKQSKAVINVDGNLDSNGQNFTFDVGAEIIVTTEMLYAILTKAEIPELAAILPVDQFKGKWFAMSSESNQELKLALESAFSQGDNNEYDKAFKDFAKKLKSGLVFEMVSENTDNTTHYEFAFRAKSPEFRDTFYPLIETISQSAGEAETVYADIEKLFQNATIYFDKEDTNNFKLILEGENGANESLMIESSGNELVFNLSAGDKQNATLKFIEKATGEYTGTITNTDLYGEEKVNFDLKTTKEALTLNIQSSAGNIMLELEKKVSEIKDIIIPTDYQELGGLMPF